MTWTSWARWRRCTTTPPRTCCRRLDNLQTTAKTISQRPQALAQLLTSATATSDTLDGFLNANGNYLIQVSASSAQVLALLAHYSPEYPCMAEGFAELEPRLEQAFGGGQPGLHITLEVVKNQGKYQAGDEPRYITSSSLRQPHCYGLPQPQVPFPGVQIGSQDGAAYNPPQQLTTLPSAQRKAYDSSGVNTSGVGSPAETSLVNAILSGSTATTRGACPASPPCWPHPCSAETPSAWGAS